MTGNRGARRAASRRGGPAPAGPTRYSARVFGGAVVLAATRPGRPVELTALAPDVAAGLAVELFVSALIVLPEDQRRARARELLAAATAMTPDEETPHADDR